MWSNKRQDGVIYKKLDRVLVSRQWLQQYDQSYSVFEPGGCSDHLKCRFYIKEQEKKVKRPFKFTNALTSMADYKETIEEIWAQTPQLHHSTAAMFMLSKKLKSMKPQLRHMGKKLLGDISIKTKEAYKKLCELQTATMMAPTTQSVHAEAVAYARWQRMSEIEEKYLRQKAKLHWMAAGDQNNKMFYIAAKSREVRNNIKEIQCENGATASNQEQIKAEAERYFKDFLTVKPPDYVEWSREELAELLEFKCAKEDTIMLTHEVSEDEIKKCFSQCLPTNLQARMGLLVSSSKKLGQSLDVISW